ncbi:MAG: PEP-CTERM sorting domain-containing protein [Burkholderiales bacterium]
MRKTLAAVIIGVALQTLATSASAITSTLTFDGDICPDSLTCGDFALIDQSYGDIAGIVDIQYDRLLGDDNGEHRLSFWTTGYSDLTNVAWGSSGDAAGTAEIFIKPLDGNPITLKSFDLGSWPNTDRGTQFTILDGDGNILVSSGAITILGAVRSHFDIDLASASGIRIQWGPSAYNVGIDNVAFEVTAVPEPQEYALLLAGLGLVGWAARRRSR